MIILKALHDILEADPAYQAARKQTYIDQAPLNADHPSATIMLVSGSDEMTHSGPDELQQDLIRIYVRGKSAQQVYVLSQAVRSVLRSYRGESNGLSIQLIVQKNRNSDHDQTADIYRQIEDYRVHYNGL